VYNVASNFGIHDHNDRQHTGLGQAIWMICMFRQYLATTRLVERDPA
jgi:hypothetical protein